MKKLSKLVLALAFGGLTLGTPVGVSAATPASTGGIEQCMMAMHIEAGEGMTLRQARTCAPEAKLLPSGRTKVGTVGTFIVRTSRGYVIVVTEAGKPVGDPCQWYGAHIYDVGVNDYMSADFCWVGYGNPWIYGEPYLSCNAYAPASACWNHYYTLPGGRYGSGGIVEVDGYFYQDCVLGFPCNDGMGLASDYTGSMWSWSWTF